MYWLCVSPEELERMIEALNLVYRDGVGDDEEAAEEEEIQKLITKLEFIRDTERPPAGGGSEG